MFQLHLMSPLKEWKNKLSLKEKFNVLLVKEQKKHQDLKAQVAMHARDQELRRILSSIKNQNAILAMDLGS